MLYGLTAFGQMTRMCAWHWALRGSHLFWMNFSESEIVEWLLTKPTLTEANVTDGHAQASARLYKFLRFLSVRNGVAAFLLIVQAKLSFFHPLFLMKPLFWVAHSCTLCIQKSFWGFHFHISRPILRCTKWLQLLVSRQLARNAMQ